MEYYSVVKLDEVLIHALTWVDLENIVLWTKPDIAGHMLSDSIYMNTQKRQIWGDRKYIRGY